MHGKCSRTILSPFVRQFILSLHYCLFLCKFHNFTCNTKLRICFFETSVDSSSFWDIWSLCMVDMYKTSLLSRHLLTQTFWFFTKANFRQISGRLWINAFVTALRSNWKRNRWCWVLRFFFLNVGYVSERLTSTTGSYFTNISIASSTKSRPSSCSTSSINPFVLIWINIFIAVWISRKWPYYSFSFIWLCIAVSSTSSRS